MSFDVAVVGAGPAGLACAIGLRLRGLSVVVYERGEGARDKACGEGIMPAGLAQLRALGVQVHGHPIAGICYVNEDGFSVKAPLAEPGLGVRRLHLSQAMRQRALSLGAVLREHHNIADPSEAEAPFVIAADGLRSPLRALAGLEDDAPRTRRFGMRRHFRLPPWTDHVEVHFAGKLEAYVTPVSTDEIGVAFLWNEDRFDASGGHAALLAHFPRLQARLAGAEWTSDVMGLGPLAQSAHAVVSEDFALVGDAAGYVDAITGEGISLALDTAAVLVNELARKRRGVMSEYARYHRRAFLKYGALAHALLALAAVPALRRRVIENLSPKLFERLLALALH